MKYLNFKLLFFLAALVLAIPPAWAGTVTVSKTVEELMNQYGWETGGGASKCYTSFNLDDNLNVSTTGNPNCGAIYGTSTHDWRLYQNQNGNVIVTAANGFTIKTVSFTFTVSNSGCLNLGNTRVTSNSDISVNAASITFTVGNTGSATNGQVRITQFSVTYESDGGNTPQLVETPTFSPEEGTFYSAQSVTISCATDGATIHYTTNGDTPDENSAVYGTPITVNETMTIKAIAVKDGMTNSEVAEATYTINAPSSLTQYRKITSTAELTNGDYLIVCENENAAFDGRLTTFDAAHNNFTVEIDNGIILTDKNAYFTATKLSSNQYAFMSASGRYFGQSGTSNKIESSEGICHHVVSFDSEGNVELLGEADNNLYLRFNKNSDQRRFRYYANTSQQPVALYKKVTDEPIITVHPTEVVIEDNDGDSKTGVISATVNPAGTVTATATDGWSATSSSVTYEGKALFAEGTASFSSQGAADVTASLEYNYTGPLYILGTVNGGTWAPNNYVAMTRGADGLYTVRVTTNAGNEGMSWISFTKRVANDNDNGAWSYIAPYRFVPFSENVNTAWWLTDGNVNQFNALDFNTDHVDGQPVRMAPGTYDITINANDNTFKIEPYIVTVETPTFDPEAGSYKTFQSVTINCATEDATIHYTVDGSEPTESSPVYSEAIAVQSTTTIKAIAMKDGMANSAVAEATYNLPQTVATVAAANSVDANSYFLFTGEAVVTYAGQSTINSNYHYIFIRDKDAENGGGVIYYNTNNNANVPNVQATNVLKRGWYARLRPYNNWKEFQNAEFVEASGETATAAPFDRTGQELKYDDNVNEYVKIDDVTYNDGNITYAGQNRDEVTYTYKVVNHFNVALEDGNHYNIEGVVTRNGSAIEFYPTAATIAKQEPELSFNPASVSVYEGVQDFPEPELIAPEGVTVQSYASSNTDVVTVDEDGKVTIVAPGTAVITATTAENTYYLSGTVTYNVEIKAKEAAGLSFGVTEPLHATFGDTEFTEPELTKPAGLAVTYTCEPETVATVDENGNVTIVGAGTATVTATTEGDESHNGGSATYTIIVAKADATLSFAEREIEATYGGEVPANALTNEANLDVTYSSGDESIATVDNKGKVTIVKAGTVTITATGAEGDNYNGATANYTLTIKKADATLSFAENEIEATYGGKVPANALTNEAGLTVTYSSGDESIATVDNNGKVTIVKAGTVTITATGAEGDNYNGATASYTLTIEKADATLSFAENEIEATYGGEVPANALTNEAGLTVTYSSSDESIATVDNQGKVTIVKAGTVTITATGAATDNYNGATASYTLTIEKADATLSFSPDNVTIVEGQEFTAPTLTNEANLDVTYKSSDEDVATVDNNGNVTIVGVGETTITATGAANDNYNGTSAYYTLTVEAKPVVAAPTFTPAAGYYNSVQNVTIACETAGADIYYTIDGTEPTTESTKYTAAIAVGENMTIKAIAVKDGYTNSEVVEAEYVIDLPVQIAAPTFMPGSGHYTEAKEVAIACATPGALISYKIGDGEFQPYTKPFVVDHSCTVTAKVSMGTRTVWTENQASATYTINTLNPVEITNGYYQIKNNGSGQYANVQGRKTLTFTNDIDQQAGTVIRVQTTNDGQVKVLRSQAADLQGYADRAMRYVPEVVQMVANKLHAEGTGELLGNEGLDAIMEKFNESFDYHLYVEGDLDNCRIYGKTPSMQPVVDFYLENQSKVDEKLPMLEGFINDAINKVLEKTNGRGSSILVPFKLQTIWERMGGNLTEPVDDASTMAFYRQVLTNKQYVWDFAYQTATFYLEKVKAHPRYEEMKDEMGEFGNYIDKLEQIRPDMKYFIVQENGKVDYISEGNVDIINNEANTYWTVQPRDSFVVNLPEASMLGIEYVTTLYTDFAYTVPEDVAVYKVTSINEQGVAQLVALTGTIPAQTPVLLKSLVSGPKTLTLDINDGTALTDNLLVGPDYLINEYQIRTPQVESVFNLAKDLFGENFYNNYVAQYEHLMLKNAGTVNNKYFWGLTEDDVKKCTFTNDEGSVDCVIRTLSDGDQHLGFYNNWEVKTNQALLVTKEFDPIKLAIKGDVTRDGLVNLSDAVALINIILLHPYEPADFPVIYDYIAADFDENGEITITDAKDLINYLLNHYEPGEMIQPTDGEGEGNN